MTLKNAKLADNQIVLALSALRTGNGFMKGIALAHVQETVRAGGGTPKIIRKAP